MQTRGLPLRLCVTSLTLAALVACNNQQEPVGGASDQDETPTQLGDIVEGDTGFFHRGATECFAEAAQPIDGTDVWIGPNGSDDNSGATEDEPFGTMSHALCNLAPGQTLHVLPGTYSASVMLAGFGGAELPIRISGEASSNGRPVFDGGGTLTMGIAIIESNNFIVEGLEFRNYTDEGLFVALTDDVEVSDCVFADNGFESIDPDANGEGFGIAVTDGRRIAISDCQAMRNGPKQEIFQTGVLGTGIDTYRISDSTITNNISADNTGGGILVEDGFGVVITGNEISGNQLDASGEYWDAGIWVDGGVDILLSGNNIHDNLGPAIQISDSDLKYPYFSCRQTVRDNILTGNYWALYIDNYGVCPLPEIENILDFSGNTVSNNVYPGSNEEFLGGTYDGEILCLEFPCGDNTPCTIDDFDRAIEHCNQ